MGFGLNLGWLDSRTIGFPHRSFFKLNLPGRLNAPKPRSWSFLNCSHQYLEVVALLPPFLPMEGHSGIPVVILSLFVPHSMLWPLMKAESETRFPLAPNASHGGPSLAASVSHSLVSPPHPCGAGNPGQPGGSGLLARFVYSLHLINICRGLLPHSSD